VDLKHFITQLAYKIEPKPGGGFLARATDPTIAPIEAPTREELQLKIQQNILDAISTEFPALKASAHGKKLDVAFHIERTPQGGFEIHSADPNAPVIHAPNQSDLETHLLEKFLNFAGQRVLSQLPQAFAAQAGSASVKVVVNNKTTFQMSGNSNGIASDATQITQPDATNLGTIDGRPITPETSSAWKVFGLALLALIIAALLYVFFGYR
jgi:hypothetical protein